MLTLSISSSETAFNPAPAHQQNLLQTGRFILSNRIESLVKRMLPPSNANVPKLSRETGIPQDTLYGWRRQAQRAQGLTRTPPAGGGERWSSEEKFAMVVETAALSEVEGGEYGRKRGLYAEHLQAWRRAGEQANRGTPSAGSGERSAERRRIRELEAELQRKD